MGRGAQGTAGPFNNDYLKENLPQLHFTYILSDTVQFLFSTNEGQDWDMVFDAFLIFLQRIFHVFFKALLSHFIHITWTRIYSFSGRFPLPSIILQRSP